MTTNRCGSASGWTWTSYSRQQGSEEYACSNTLCHQTKPRTITTISNPNNGRNPGRARIGLRLLMALSIFLWSAVAHAHDALYGFESDKELLFDRRSPPTMQIGTVDSRHTALSRRNVGWESSLHSRSRPHTPLPRPFDSSLGNNFTSSSCPAFFETFLNNASFHNCLPFSMLLQTSNAFFDATRSKSKLTGVLAATCNVDYQQCSRLMTSYAEQIQQQENCGADFKLQNPLVEQAYNGFIAYQPMYRAGCLKDDRGDFCFANAATNRSSPASSYIYYLPLGIQLPSTVTPACNTCLRDTMAVLATFAGDASQPLNSDYDIAAQHVESYCNFRHVKLPVESTSGVSSLTQGHNGMALWITLLVLSSVLL